jgi:hypothetical protein
VRALIVQNANAYSEGVTPELRDTLVRLSTDSSPEMRAQADLSFQLPYTKRQYLEGVADRSRVSPDAWQHAQWGMDRPGNKDIQYALHANYAYAVLSRRAKLITPTVRDPWVNARTT